MPEGYLKFFGVESLQTQEYVPQSIKLKSCFQVRREICNLAFGDLPQILQQEAFVVNKFDTELDHTVVDCLKYWVYGS